ncbi:hypothetical protein J2T57_004281 [Natronocella acetinitrilica]|uniref:Uncharacterized protein n=1 Tax=Natronocella acetinitrilica TaxID=414046 RepID=A0AAE3KI77_9GAMM|nr:hypothetical protein [Natronocella acetinitrilica]MCP1677107.1 hypothetical protein [Natronocella acetinitrilica]
MVESSRLQRAIHTLLISSASALLLAGCIGGGGGGGGGSSSGGGSGSSPSGDTLAELTGLTGDAGNEEYLYFTSAFEGAAGLYRVDPLNPGTPELVDSDLGSSLLPTMIAGTPIFLGIQPGEYDRFLLPITEATLEEDGAISDFRVAQVLYGEGFATEDPNGYQRAPTARGSTATPSPVSSQNLGAPLLSAFIQNDLTDALGTAIFNRISGEQFLVGDDGDTAPLEISGDLRAVAGVFDPDQARHAGYLVIDETNGDTIRMVGTDLELLPGNVLADGEPVSGVTRATVVGPTLGLGLQYIALSFDDTDGDDSTPPGELWLYTPDPGTPGTLTRLTNGAGDALRFPVNLFNQDELATPSPATVVAIGDSLYFPTQGQFLFASGFEIIRASPTGWTSLIEEDVSTVAFMLSAGNRLVYHIASSAIVVSINMNGGDRQVIDLVQSASISPVARGDANGWVYFNREQGSSGNRINVAVAVRANGSDKIELVNARWVGASTSGRAATAEQLDALELSEVFLLRDSGELAAVSAGTPGDGAVTLGELPNSASDARMFGLAPGPYRLLQTVIGEPTDNPSHEVILVNTREADSLRVVSFQLIDNGNQRPVRGF